MKATCPSCSTSYKVGDEKIPDMGAQIKCPKCGTLFVVRRPPAAPAPAPAPVLPPPPVSIRPPTPVPSQPMIAPQPPFVRMPVGQAVGQGRAAAHEQSTPIDVLVGGVAAPPPQAPAPAPSHPAPAGSKTPNLDALTGEAFVSLATQAEMTEAAEIAAKQPRGVSAIRAQSGAARKPAGAGLLDGFKVRTQRGLTYDFSSREAMERWLIDRDDLAGCEVNEPGGNWVPAVDVLSRRQSTSRPAPAAGPPPGAVVLETEKPPQAPFAQPLRMAVAGRAVGDRAGAVVWIALVFMFLALLAGVAVTLTRYGIFDLSTVLPLQELGIHPPAATGPVIPIKSTGAPKPQDPEQVYAKAMGDGSQALRSARFSKAAMEYNRALSVHPGSVEALEGLSKAYLGMGDKDRALELKKKAQSIEHR